MVYYVTYLKDTVANNYLGIKIDNQTVEPYLNKLKEILSDDYDVYIDNQQKRDHGSYHITVVNVMDYNKLSKEMGISSFINSLDPIFKYEIDDIKMLGIGTARRNENQTYFIVCKSDKLDSIRKRYNLPEHDFHITIGFKWRDVFGVRKNQVLENYSIFLKLLKSEFYKKENFNFVKNLSNFDMNKDFDIIPISIEDTYLKVLCDNTIMDIGVIEDKDGNSLLKILTKYKAEKEYNRLPLTEIYKILEKIK
jgi:hypothetical protein